jgi:pimeloyl-ACP methyl ester carboxylesterase
MKTKLLNILFVSLIIASCSKETSYDEFVYIHHEGADMPVLVRGNEESEIYLIYIHGGPGGSTFIDVHNNFFSEIEEEYSVVYYDQRASGNSQGKANKDQINIEQYVEDLDVIVSYVRQELHAEKIILLGHSWGGTLGSAYLLTDGMQNNVDGWIEVDGGHNFSQHAFEISRDFVIEKAEQLKSDRPDKAEYYQEIIDSYDDIQSWRDPDDVILHSTNTTNVEGYFYDQEKRAGLVGFNQIINSETSFINLLLQNEFVIRNMDVWYLDYTSKLDEIKIPMQILWGKYDGILPVELGIEAFEASGITEDNFYIFNKSGHSPHYEETELFNEKVIEFIKREIEK